MKRLLGLSLVATLSILASAAGQALGGQARGVRLSAKPTAERTNGKTSIAFTLSAGADVEVAILGGDGEVVRHLAAGVLGGKTPPPAPLKPGLLQKIEWDGNDDYGEKAKGGPFRVRVRAGMGVKLEKIVGGDPYAYYSRQMGQGDHARWDMRGIEVKSDGKVYVLGNVTNIGPAALRQYDAEGKYVRTVYPPPAGLSMDKVKAWGAVAKSDGTYSLKYNCVRSPAIGMLPVSGNAGTGAKLLPSPDRDSLLLSNGKLFKINTDGTADSNPWFGKPFVGKPAMRPAERNVWKIPWRLTGPVYTCLSPDGKHFYLSGVFAGTTVKTRRVGAEKTGAWRDGQLFKVDAVTREAKAFFSLPGKAVMSAMKARGASPIGDTTSNPYAAFHGVATDGAGNVFLCDRQNKRVVVLDPSAKVLRELPVANPDAVAVSPKTKAIYVTTRFGNYHRKGELKLLRFNDWTRDSKPSDTLPLCSVGTYPHGSQLAVAEAKGKVMLWVAYAVLPVRIYEDNGAGLKLVKDFYAAGPQRCLDVQHMAVDPKTEDVYVTDVFKNAFRIRDWREPRFERCMSGEKTPLRALSLAIDVRNRLLYAHNYMRGKVKHSLYRYRLDRKYIEPAPIGGAATHAISGKHRVGNYWNIGFGQPNRGIAVSPDGGVAALGSTEHTDYSGPLHYFARNDQAVPWKPMWFECLGRKPATAGIRFDPAGNLYVGVFGRDKCGRIVTFAPTGKLADGNLYPKPPAKPSRVYDVDYGFPGGGSPPLPPRFGVDGYGRICYPTSLEPRVTLIDNAGNEILRFGTYGNRDSMGGLEGDPVPTRDVPMAWPSSVDATDDYVYVSDIVNARVLRLAKTFAAAESCPIR
jgi:DNA-binding beta-propeller fold protein YncE